MTGPAREVNAILTVAYRDVLKFLRDPARLVQALIFPIIFIGILGGSFQSNIVGEGYNFLTFIFTGVLIQTLFQSTTSGIISLIEDRENDFSQEIFISPISRYSIVFGKILGESLVALVQGIGVIIFGIVFGVPFTLGNALGMIPIAIAACLLGGSFGLILLSSFGSQRAANQILPFLVFPQIFTAGVFNPIHNLPWYLDFLSRISPLRYAVDLARDVFYAGKPEYARVVLAGPLTNLTIMVAMFAVFLFIGTTVFVRSERNK
ncbi:MAG: ABC transporter permease [Chloroflexi bacterium]|nr:ABC transporter permease [Ktedonobacteraceae bacterium]MBV9707947.1 ABC transporter permease [Chloroflexota bacterium]